MENNYEYRCAFLNIRGQSGLPISKQLQIEQFIKTQRLDALHLQEINIDSDSFTTCDFISSNYNVFPNNSMSKYGTASLGRADIEPENLRCDTQGRVQVYDIGDLTFANIYFHSGTDNISRAGREKLCSEVLPNLLINSKANGYIGGNFNCIIDKHDATHHPNQKMSHSLSCLVSNKSWKDCY